jgi:hypothetical protein
MARAPRSVDQAIARFDEYAARLDGHVPAAAMGARRRVYGRAVGGIVRRVAGMGVAIGVLVVATIVFSQLVGPIGLAGLFVVALSMLAVLLVFSLWPAEPERTEYREDMPTASVVRQLERLLVRERAALPGPAVRRVDAISAQLPLLESRLAEADALDPLAHDARRLMGRHLPELIERYEKVPPAYRQERDGEGKTVDERLVASLEAARVALDEVGARLAEGDRRAFETHGRFIESRYRDGGDLKGE